MKAQGIPVMTHQHIVADQSSAGAPAYPTVRNFAGTATAIKRMAIHTCARSRPAPFMNTDIDVPTANVIDHAANAISSALSGMTCARVQTETILIPKVTRSPPSITDTNALASTDRRRVTRA